MEDKFVEKITTYQTASDLKSKIRRILENTKSEILNSEKTISQNRIVSRLNFGFWLLVFKTSIVLPTQVFIHHKKFLNNLTSFSSYNEEYMLRLLPIQIKIIALYDIARVIRNRAFHCENLLKINDDQTPRLTRKTKHNKKEFKISVIPSKIEIFLDAMLLSMKEDILDIL